MPSFCSSHFYFSTPQFCSVLPDASKQVQPNMEALFQEFKDCCMGDQVGYQSQTILSILNVQTALMQSTKFQLMFLGEMSNISCVDPDRRAGGLDLPP